MNANDVTSGRQPLLRPDGQWDQVALAAWFQDDACWKTAMPDDDLSWLGPRAGDLLITDDGVEPYIGGLALVTDGDLFAECIGTVDRDNVGRLCVECGGDLVPIEGDDAAGGLVLMVIGYVPLPSGEAPALKDLLRAQALPREVLPPRHGRFYVTPIDLPF